MKASVEVWSAETWAVPFIVSTRREEGRSLRVSWKLLLSTVVFVLCIAPTFVSYEPYSFAWDDSDYLVRSIAASRAFWLGDGNGLRSAVVSIRPPIMTLLGLPWGPLGTWDAAGKCFITLTALTSFFAAMSLYLLLRTGVKPLFLIIAGMGVFAALGPYPAGADAHTNATGFLADSLFAWNVLGSLLLISYERTTKGSSTAHEILRGILWGAIFSVGLITKVSYLYFIVLVVPILFFIRMRRNGLRSALVSLVSLGACLLPPAVYWLRYGLTSLKNGWAASFGHDAPFYFIPLTKFVGETIRQSPGLLLVGILMVAGIAYLVANHRELALGTNVLPILIMLGYCIIGLASKNRDIRYLFPGMIALPFLVALLISRETDVFPRKSATIAAIVAFCCLVAAGLPMLHRANRQSIANSESVLAQAVASNAKRVLLATDSPSLNLELMKLAIAVSSSQPQVEPATLSWRAAVGSPIEDDFRNIREADLVVFQNKEALSPAFTNQRVSEYERYARQYGGDVPVRVAGDISIYQLPCN